MVNSTTHQNQLSLPFLHELSLSNLQLVKTLREKLTIGSFLTYSFALLVSILLCSTVWLGYNVLRTRRHDNPRTNGDVELTGHRDGDHLKGGGGTHPVPIRRNCRVAGHIRWQTRAVRKLPTPHSGCHRPESGQKHSPSK